jgi:hypothetical protein
MHITLDDDTWDVSDQTPVMEVLADISDRAHANGRLISTLIAGDRSLTDRDLCPSLLAQEVGKVGPLRATSTAIGEMVRDTAPAARQYAACLAREGSALVERFRRGDAGLTGLDQWLGKLADYLEWVETVRAYGSEIESEPFHRQVSALLSARDDGDLVRIADLLEYELVPRLAS